MQAISNNSPNRDDYYKERAILNPHLNLESRSERK